MFPLHSKTQRNRRDEHQTDVLHQQQIQFPGETLGFIVEIPVSFISNEEFGFGRDRSLIVLARKYIKATNTLRKDYKYEAKRGILPEDLDFANRHLQLLFVLNTKTTLEKNEIDYTRLASNAKYFNDLFKKLNYPARVEISLWQPEPGKKSRFPFRMVRAIPLYQTGELRKKIDLLVSKNNKTFLLFADADLVSLHPHGDKAISIFNSIRNRYLKAKKNSVYPPYFIRLLGGYHFSPDEIWHHIRLEKQEEPDLIQSRTILLTQLFNQIDMATRALLSIVHPNLAYFAEPNSAYDW